ncbi:MAG: glycosyltransferase family 2 protein [Nitrospira sp.]|nr:glycosyltransferase family 2 protein [Nitrospira sp.]
MLLLRKDLVPQKQHISVCICTYKRPELLVHLLSKLKEQETEGLFEFSVVIVDNDRFASARQSVESCARQSKISIDYYVEPEQNIALARNKALENAKGDLIGFIDDDEFPKKDWLVCLFKAYKVFNADGVLGPVYPFFDGTPPKWILRSRYFERPSHRTGTRLQWEFTRTGNVLFRTDILQGSRRIFNERLGCGGEDRDFFRRMILKGHKFIWCNEAPVHEFIPPMRWEKSIMLRRALLRGQESFSNPSYSKFRVGSCMMALSYYTLISPFLLLLGEHVFMKYLITGCDHLGTILAFLGFKVVKEKYIF